MSTVVTAENIIYSASNIIADNLSKQVVNLNGGSVFVIENFSPYWYSLSSKYNETIPDYLVKPWTKRTIIFTNCPAKLYIDTVPSAGSQPQTSPYFTSSPYVRYLNTSDTRGVMAGEISYLSHTSIENEITIQPSAGATFAISGSVSLNAGQSIAINGNVPVTASDTGGLPVTTGSSGLSVAVNNTVNMAITSSTVTIPVSQVGTFDVSITSSTVSLDVNINAGQSVAVSGSVPVTASDTGGLPVTTGSSGLSVAVNNTVNMAITSSTVTLPVSGDVNATIQNATIDTNSTVLNEQISVGLPLAGYGTVTIAASGVAPVPYANTATITPDGTGLLNLGMFQFSMVSANGYPYQVTIQPVLTLNGVSIPLVAGIVFDLSSSSASGYGTTEYMIRDNLGAVYQANALSISFLQTYSTTAQEADTVTFYWAVDGSSVPDVSTVLTPESVQIGMTNSSGDGQLISPTYPLPTQSTITDTAGDVVPVGYNNPLPVFTDNYPQSLFLIGTGAVPDAATYNTTGTGIAAIGNIFGTLYNTATSAQYVNLLFQNDDATASVFTMVLHVDASSEIVVNFPFPNPWAPFGMSGVSLNFGWDTATADTVYGTLYVQAASAVS